LLHATLPRRGSVRTLNGDLGLRPILHHKAERFEAHLFVAFHAYGLSITRCRQLRGLAPGLKPRVFLGKLATVQLLDVAVPTTDGRELLLVRRTELGRDVALLLDRVVLTLPSQPPPMIRSPRPVCSGDLWPRCTHHQSLLPPIASICGSRATSDCAPNSRAPFATA
jgi:hypothetical protein